MQGRLLQYSESMDFIHYKESAPGERFINHTKQSMLRWFLFLCVLLTVTFFAILYFSSNGWFAALWLGFIFGSQLAVIIYRLRAGSHWGYVLEYIKYAWSRSEVPAPKEVLNVRRAIRVISVSEFDNGRFSKWFDREPSALVEEITEENSFEIYRIYLDRDQRFFSKSISRLQPGAVGGCLYHQYGSSRHRLMRDFQPSSF